MSKPDRYDAADLRCDACQSNTDIYGIMKTHDKGRWVKWDDYAALVRLQVETLEERNKAEAENDRLRKAGDAMAAYFAWKSTWNENADGTPLIDQKLAAWLAAKEGRNTK